MFEAALKHEQFITRCINDLMKQAADEGDYASQILLQWYVTEQVEEEANATAILGQLKLAGASGGAQLMLDHQLGKREFKG
jgi:ferritin